MNLDPKSLRYALDHGEMRKVVGLPEVPAAPPEKRANKYNTVRTDGCASKKEAKRLTELRLMEAAGHISNLRTQVRFVITINGVWVCAYVADAVYLDALGHEVVEDTKGFRTREYRLKKRLMKACHDIDIHEV